MSSGKIFLGNDHIAQVVNLRNAEDLAFIVGGEATVGLTLRSGSGPTSSEVGAGPWPVSMNYKSIAGESVGGVDGTGTRTIVSSADGLDLLVSVGPTNPLSLAAGTLVHLLHKEDEAWKVSLAESIAADGSGRVHVDPWIWESSREPTKVKLTDGEILVVTDGIWEGILEDTVPLVAGTIYYGHIEVDATTIGRQARFVLELEAEDRVS